MEEPDRFGAVDSKLRFVGIGVRPLQSCTAATEDVDAAARCRPEEQARGERGFREVVMVAAEHVADPGGVDITLDRKTRRQAKADGAPKNRRAPLLRVGVAEPAPPIVPTTTARRS